eukprot:m.68938 g.68938  ORF g.68938 m.68938 type:complete len:245 (-) comp16742_c0_seq4:64-798(-)
MSAPLDWSVAAAALTQEDVEFLSKAPEQHEVVHKGGRANRRERRNAQPNIWINHQAEKNLRAGAAEGNVEKVEKALAEGANVNAADDKKRAALHFACTSGKKEVVACLLEHGVDVNQRDLNGNTALHLAACTNHTDIITLLLKAGTDVHAKDAHGNTPLSYAQSHLRFLQRFHNRYSTEVYRGRIAQVVELLKEYFGIVGDRERQHDVDMLEQQLAMTSTQDDVDAFSKLLDDFTTLSLERQKK